MNHLCASARPTAQVRPLAVLALVLCMVLGPALNAVAAQPPRAVAIGESNDDAERAELLAFFGADVDADVVPVTVEETLRAADAGFDLSGVDTAYSSAAIVCASAGAGVAVVTRNIELVPPALYALALVTAGVTDVQLAVAAPADNAALGMTALIGVFKAWDAAPCGAEGQDAARRELALEEVALVARIGQAQDGAAGVLALTDVMQEAQRRVIAGDDPAQALAAAAARAHLDLSADDRADGAAFLTRLMAAGIAWADFAHGWTLGAGPKGDGVLLAPVGRRVAAAAGKAAPTGVGGEAATATPRSTSTPAPTSTALATVTIAATNTVVAAAGVTHAETPPSAGGRGAILNWRWAALAFGLGLLALLGWLLLGARRRRPVMGAARISPAVAAAAVARRRAGERAGSMAHAVVAAAPRRISVRRRVSERS